MEVGSTIGQYEIVAHLSAGGMASLFLGRRKGAAGFARHVAIKVVHPHLACDTQFVHMFVDEAKLAARIQHPNVVHVEELGQEDGVYFLVMEYVHGCSLAELLTALARMRRRLTPDIAIWIAMQVAEGLHAAHDTGDSEGRLLGVVHRDVSPQNVLLAAKGHVKLIDFGIAKARGRQQETVGGVLKGKFRYMAPEQGRSSAVDRRTDVYALGIVLWEMLTMRRMYTGRTDVELLNQVRDPKIEPPSRYASIVKPEIDRIVMAALSPRPDDRPASALELRRMLAESVPGAAAIDSTQLASVIEAVVGETLERRREALPQSMSGMWEPLSTQKLDPTEPSGASPAAPHARQEVLKSLTVSAPGASYGDADSERPEPVIRREIRDEGPGGAGADGDEPDGAPATSPSGARGRLPMIVMVIAAALAAGAGGAVAAILVVDSGDGGSELDSEPVRVLRRGLEPSLRSPGAPEAAADPDGLAVPAGPAAPAPMSDGALRPGSHPAADRDLQAPDGSVERAADGPKRAEDDVHREDR